MSQDVTPEQALFLWKMITGRTAEVREPMQSKASPKLSAAERKALVAKGYLSEEGRGKNGARPIHLVLTDKAWSWASRARDVRLPEDPGAQALQGLLQYLLPFLEERELILASLFAGYSGAVGPGPGEPQRVSKASKKKASKASRASKKPSKAKASKASNEAGKKKASQTSKRGKVSVQAVAVVQAAPLTERVEAACLSLTGGQRKRRVRLSALRDVLHDVPRAALDRTLLELQDAGRAVLYRDDNSAALTEADHAAALIVGDAPRHIVYLEA